jgi:flagellar biosynthesis/type III secretory pathway protein FliH
MTSRRAPFAGNAIIRPFLPIVPTPTRPLGAALPAVITPPVTSWLPRPAEAAPVAAAASAAGRSASASPAAPAAAAVAAIDPAELDRLRDAARDAGRAEGLAETASLRAQLAAVLDQIDAARASIVPPAAAAIAEIATCVVETWIGNIYPGLTFAPIVQRWLAHAADQPTTVRVHPADAAALAEAIKDAPLTIASDPSLARGALELTSETRELVHNWNAHLGDLRIAIVTALTGVDE